MSPKQSAATVETPEDPNDLVEIVVVADALMWNETDKGSRRGYLHHGEVRGWRGFVPRKVLDDPRHAGEWVLASEYKVAAPQPLPPSVVMTDEQLASATEADLLAYLVQNPGEAARISEIELKRSVPRENVVFAADEVLAQMEAKG